MIIVLPTTSQLNIVDNKNLIERNTPCEERMTKSFSNLHGVFCFTYLQNGQRCSLWSGNLFKLMDLYFKFDQGNIRSKELVYFPFDSDYFVTIFRGIV